MSGSADIIYSSGPFGEYSPYYATIDGRTRIYDTLKEAIEDNAEKIWDLDIAAVLSLLNFNYILGDRTLVENICRVPWHSDITSEGEVLRRPPIPHGHILIDERAIAKRMYELLCTYLYEYVTSCHSVIWLTLSGGYDSRIIAGLLKKIATNRNEVKVLNWGIPNSRDVVYASKIAEHYAWEYIYIPYDHNYNIDLIKYTVDETGAEISSIDYNPIEVNPSILERIGSDDAIIFSHYGDGIGRGAYGGKHLRMVRLKKIANPFVLFNSRYYKTYKRTIEDDRKVAWITDCSRPEVRRIAMNELDRHENYIRRTLTKRFKFCRKYIPFAHTDLVKFIYSLSPQCRNDKVYAHILSNIDKFLYELPWARTGTSFSGIHERNPSLVSRQHNKLHDFVKLSKLIKPALLNSKLVENSIINKDSLSYILKLWPKYRELSMLVSKLYGIELLIQKHNLTVRRLKTGDSDKIKIALGSRGYFLAQQAKRSLRKLVG